MKDPGDVRSAGYAIDTNLSKTVSTIMDSIRRDGESALVQYAQEFDNLGDPGTLYYSEDDLQSALDLLSEEDRRRLEQTAGRIGSFARAQRSCVNDLEMSIPGGQAGHTIRAVTHAGCYVPGGRYPLPSSVLMTAIPAHVAGVETVWVASPRPGPLTLAAAAVAGASGLVAAGGAQAIAALAYGTTVVPPSDVIVGPGNAYVTEAKRQISGTVRIDMLAGPSELVIVADDSADPSLIAADLLAQAEHDPDALPLLISLSEKGLGQRVEESLCEQLRSLPTADTARAALSNGGILHARDRIQASTWCDALAPEHVQLCIENPGDFGRSLKHYGTVFIGEKSAEVLGDYGAGPNHVLPTAGTARSTSGLSVFTFLRFQTWLTMNGKNQPYGKLLADATWFARMEGLEGHARASEIRG